MYYKKLKNILFILSAIIIVSLPLSCAKENPVNKLIPYVRVDLQINPLSPQFVPGPNGNGDLSIPGNWAYVSGGYRGIIIYNTGFDDFRYKAYERTSPYNYPNSSNCRVNVDETGLFAIDQCSDTRYNLFDNAYPDQGPGVLPLKQYRTRFDGIYLHVFN